MTVKSNDRQKVGALAWISLSVAHPAGVLSSTIGGATGREWIGPIVQGWRASGLQELDDHVIVLLGAFPLRPVRRALHHIQFRALDQTLNTPRMEKADFVGEVKEL